MNMPPHKPLSAAESRRILVAFLLRNDKLPPQSRHVSPDAIFRGIYQESEAVRKAPDWEAMLTYWWDLARVGGVVLVGGGEAPARGFPSFVLTDFGRALLNEKDVSPHDREGYMAALRAIPSVDAIALTYAEEAVGAWHAQLHRASAVMLGCACERLVLLVADAVRGNADLSPYAADLAKMFAPSKKAGASTTRVPGISEVFTRVRAAVHVVGGEEFDRTVTSVFEHARTLRNDAGHPTGRAVTKQEALAGLVLFPGFYDRAVAIAERVRAYTR